MIKSNRAFASRSQPGRGLGYYRGISTQHPWAVCYGLTQMNDGNKEREELDQCNTVRVEMMEDVESAS